MSALACCVLHMLILPEPEVVNKKFANIVFPKRGKRPRCNMVRAKAEISSTPF
jgi:hypothetical protein